MLFLHFLLPLFILFGISAAVPGDPNRRGGKGDQPKPGQGSSGNSHSIAKTAKDKPIEEGFIYWLRPSDLVSRVFSLSNCEVFTPA
jgi:hypothetical protein